MAEKRAPAFRRATPTTAAEALAKMTFSPPRRAPGALAVYLSAAGASLSAAARASTSRDTAWRETIEHRALVLTSRLRQYDPDEIRAAVAKAGVSQLADAIEGIEAYRVAPPLRRPPDPPTIWSDGSARLLDFGSEDAKAPAVVAIPSLINRARILDLSRARSLMRGLRARGVRPLLLDWGDPGVEEQGFGLAEYITRRIAPALNAARRASGRRVAILGHCMGGTLAIAAAQLYDVHVSRLVLIATPWDASELLPPEGLRPDRATLEKLFNACGAIFGGVPPDLLDLLFFSRDPLQMLRKFPTFAKLSRNSARGRLFVAVEDWLNDGVRLAAPAARELFIDWAIDNQPLRGQWRVDGTRIRPDQLRTPALVVASQQDTITPYASALSAHHMLPEADLIEPRAGHVGMIVGRHAEQDLWDPLANWLRSP